jgi:hypothetical protein
VRDRGAASLELALGAGLLVIPALLVVVSFGPWLEGRAFARAAAAEAARAAVLSQGDPAVAGSELVADMVAGRGIDPALVRVSMCGGPSLPPGSGQSSCVLARGAMVTASVSVTVPLISTPWGPVGGLTVAASHAEPVDAYRSLP